MDDITAFYQKQLIDFYSPHFKSPDDLTDFLSDAFDYENGSITKRQMLYQVQRFVSLANNIEIISPNSDGLKILFLRICLESLQSLSNCDKKSFFQTFGDYFSIEGKDYILNHFKLAFIEIEYRGRPLTLYHDNITLPDFLWIIKVIRDSIVHDGKHWSMLFFARDEDSIWLTSMETGEEMNKVIEPYKLHLTGNKMIEYHFETTLNYEKFIYYFVEACINFICKKAQNDL